MQLHLSIHLSVFNVLFMAQDILYTMGWKREILIFFPYVKPLQLLLHSSVIIAEWRGSKNWSLQSVNRAAVVVLLMQYVTPCSKVQFVIPHYTRKLLRKCNTRLHLIGKAKFRLHCVTVCSKLQYYCKLHIATSYSTLYS